MPCKHPHAASAFPGLVEKTYVNNLPGRQIDRLNVVDTPRGHFWWQGIVEDMITPPGTRNYLPGTQEATVTVIGYMLSPSAIDGSNTLKPNSTAQDSIILLNYFDSVCYLAFVTWYCVPVLLEVLP